MNETAPATPLRVGFHAPSARTPWLGGVSYLRNLLASPIVEQGIEPVLLASKRAPLPEGLGGAELVRSGGISIHDALSSVGFWLRLGAAPLLDGAARRAGLACLSHEPLLGPRARTPLIAWIPDLQHRRLPDFFSQRERSQRDRLYGLSLRQAARVIVSSEAARADVDRCYPGHSKKLRVLRFVASPPAGSPTPLAELEARYGFHVPFFALPNQFWVHKNHDIVLRALALLRDRGRLVHVLATGSSEDFRAPGHFVSLMRRRDELGLGDLFRVLGVVPRRDLVGLLEHAVAVVNPSLFEGWSTTVEEAKSLGKRVVLSDIDVHREQAPERATYFDPSDPEALADALWSAWTSLDEREGKAAAERAAAALPGRRRAFAETYAAVVREVVAD